jgi:hypothetical protein
MLSVKGITIEGLPSVIASWLPARMETQDIRLARFRLLWERDYGKNIAALARAIKKDKNQVRFYLNPEKPGGRWMGEDMAREIEITLNLGTGWMDRESDDDVPENIAAFIARVKTESAQRDLPDHIQQTILTLITSSPKKEK